jgi:hypothetical protein
MTFSGSLGGANLVKIGSGTGFFGNGFDQGFSGVGTEIITVLETETYFLAVALLTGLFVQYIRCRAKQKLLKNHRPDFATHAAAHQRDRLPRDAAPLGSDLHRKAATSSRRNPYARLKNGKRCSEHHLPQLAEMS